jgi:endoglucanase Acf2
MGKRMYYYFYGSTSQGDNGDDRGANGESAPPPGPSRQSSHAATESDSLVGECLVPTDNEEDTPKNTNADFQQLLISQESGQLHPLASTHPDESSSKNFFKACVARYKRFRRNHATASHTLLVVAGTMLCLSLLALVFSPTGIMSRAIIASTNPITTAQQRAKNFKMVWPEIDRAAYNDPVGNFLDPTLFHSSLLHDGSSSNGQRQFIFPFPTGAFWTNLVMPPTADKGLSYPIAVYPYGYKWSDCLLEASYPVLHRNEQPKAIRDYFFPDLTFGVSQVVTARKIVAFDPLSVTLRYYTDKKDTYWETYLVQGSPYVTIKYSHTSPIITAFSTFTDVICPREDLEPLDIGNWRGRRNLKLGVCSSNIDPTQPTNNGQNTTLHGVQFTIQTREGVRWIVFASELATLDFETVNRTTIMVSGENGKAFTGVLRFAVIPPTRDQQHASDSVTTQTSSALDQILQSTGTKRLIYHAGVYPVSGAVSWSFRPAATETTDLTSNVLYELTGASESTLSSSSASKMKGGRVGTIEFKYETLSFTATVTGPKSLLMLALPHHARSMSSSAQLGNDMFDLVYTCIKGPMRPVLGSTWSYDEPLPSLGFDGDSGSNSEKLFLSSPGVRSKILANLKEDVKLTLPTATENIYGFGKQAARLAQIAHIAHVMQNGNTTNASQNPSQMSPETEDESDTTASTVFQEAKQVLRGALEGLLHTRDSDSLVYDANLGGMVTTDGLLNSHADFGNGRYNDHHFHYGYLLYACAIMGKIDPLFVKEFGDAVGKS